MMRESPMFIQTAPGTPERFRNEQIRGQLYLAFQGRVCRSGPNMRAFAHQSMKRRAHSV